MQNFQIYYGLYAKHSNILDLKFGDGDGPPVE